MTREDKAIEFLKIFEGSLFNNEEEDNLSHMSGDLDMCGTTMTLQAADPKRIRNYKNVLKCKKCWDKAVRQANGGKDPDNNLPEVEF